jgi:hypothetical protein
MISRSRSRQDTTPRWEALTNWLALLTLLALGIVWAL